MQTEETIAKEPCGQDLSSPQVAIVIAAYCAKDTILRALKSACGQTVPVEIVVVDDCSTDDTYQIALNYAQDDPRIQVIRQSENTGPAGARNTGISATTAPWIAVLDSDDYMAPDRIARLLDQAEGYDLLADDIYKVQDTDLGATDNRLWSREDFGHFDISFAKFVEGNRRNRYGDRGELGFVKPLMRRAFLEKHGLSYAKDLRLAEDYLLYAKALAAGAHFRMIDPCGYFAVFRENSLSSEHSTKDLRAIVDADAALAHHTALSQSDRHILKKHKLDVQKEWAWRSLIDAVKGRDWKTVATLSVQPPAVVVSLLGKLSEQVWLRGPMRLVGRLR